MLTHKESKIPGRMEASSATEKKKSPIVNKP